MPGTYTYSRLSDLILCSEFWLPLTVAKQLRVHDVKSDGVQDSLIGGRHSQCVAGRERKLLGEISQTIAELDHSLEAAQSKKPDNV